VSGMQSAVQTVLGDCLAVQADENVLVVTDPQRRSIAEALVEQSRFMGAETVFAEMSERENNGTEPPDGVAAAMLECDVCVAPTTKSLSHTQARFAASERGARIATMPQVTEDMLVRMMAPDFAEVRRRSGAVAKLLTDGREVHITSGAGTDVTFFVEGRRGLADDGDLRAHGAFGNLPAGEGFVAPVENMTQGRIVFDGSIWPMGKLADPLTVEIEDGYATRITGGAATEFQSIVEPYGREAFAVAELGIGTNECARLSGNVLEDEKILGTIHVAFGDNHSFGGTIRVSSHQDGIVLKPTVRIDGTTVLEDGELLV
jgi:leucyl aminopeptidase (aminopeptidase T)